VPWKCVLPLKCCRTRTDSERAPDLLHQLRNVGAGTADCQARSQTQQADQAICPLRRDLGYIRQNARRNGNTAKAVKHSTVYDANSFLNIDAKIAPVHYPALEHRIISEDRSERGGRADRYVGRRLGAGRIDA